MSATSNDRKQNGIVFYVFDFMTIFYDLDEIFNSAISKM